jgi:hypothetical protein
VQEQILLVKEFRYIYYFIIRGLSANMEKSTSRRRGWSRPHIDRVHHDVVVGRVVAVEAYAHAATEVHVDLAEVQVCRSCIMGR